MDIFEQILGVLVLLVSFFPFVPAIVLAIIMRIVIAKFVSKDKVFLNIVSLLLFILFWTFFAVYFRFKWSQ